MQPAGLLHGLAFEEYLIPHDDIRPISGIDVDPVVVDRQVNLLLERDVGQPEIMTQTAAIDGFEKPRPEIAVNPHRQTDNPLGSFSIVVGFEVHAADPVLRRQDGINRLINR